MKYRIFDLKYSPEEEEDFAQGCKEILREGFLTNHTNVQSFEDLFKKRQSCKYALAVSNGTAALEVALRALNVKDKYVFVQSNTFIATAVAIIAAGGIPYILDIENEWLGLSPQELSSAIKSLEGDKIGAVIAVHIGGHIAPSLLQVKSVCDEFNIPLVEDCAQSHFAQLNNINAGNFGSFGCFSFFTTKTMTTGEGGMVVSNDESLYAQSKMIRRFGMDLTSKTDHVRDGGNFKLNEFSALLGKIELDRVDQRIKKRRLLAHTYQENLDPQAFHVIGEPKNGYSSYYKQIVLIKGQKLRQDLEDFLNINGIPLSGGVYYRPLHMQPSMQAYVLNKNFPNSTSFADKHFCPPCYPELEVKDVEFICQKINEWGAK